MRRTFRILAGLIAGLVVVQAAAIAWAVAGEGHYIERGGAIDQASVEAAQNGGDLPFPEVVGYIIHGLNGGLVLPVLALVLFVVSFWARFPRSVALGAGVFGLVLAQVMLGYSLHGLPFLGALHGANALAVLSLAAFASFKARTPAQVLDQPSGDLVDAR